jgi:hypothetical protein
MSTEPSRNTSTRGHPRYLFDAELRVIAEANLVRSRTLDLGTHGTAGIFNTELKVGASVLLEFSVPPNGTSVKVPSVVRNRTGTRYGFEFVELTNRNRAAIRNACRLLHMTST